MLKQSQIVQLIRYADQTEMPWKNGSGLTREIARQSNDAQPYWRLSLATVDRSGPFSILPGCERIILLIEGQPMSLHFDDGEVIALIRNEPRHFSCERALQAVLPGPGERRDLNLIWSTDVLSADVQLISVVGTLQLTPSAAYRTIAVAMKGSALARVDDEDPRMIVAGDTLVLHGQDTERPPALAFQATEAELVLFRLHERSERERAAGRA